MAIAIDFGTFKQNSINKLKEIFLKAQNIRIAYIFFLIFFVQNSTTISYKDLTELKENFAKTKTEITVSLDKQITNAMTEMLQLIEKNKEQTSFKNLTSAWEKAKNSSAGQNYFLATELIIFLQQLSEKNAGCIDQNILNRISYILEQIKTKEIFLALNPTLKKEKTALLEMSEEKNFIETIQNLITFHLKDLMQQEMSLQQTFFNSELFLNCKTLQEQYLATTFAKKIVGFLDTIQNLIDKKIALVHKNKQCQQMRKVILMFDSSFNPATKEELKLQNELAIIRQTYFLIPLKNI